MPKRGERTRNAGTTTEAAFWGVIRSALRDRFNRWPKTVKGSKCGWQPKKIAIERVQKKINGSLHVPCAACHQWFKKSPPNKGPWEAHHILECGSLPKDANEFIDRLFCEDPDMFVVLCKPCHDKETARLKRG